MLYVDDMFVACSPLLEVEALKKKLSNEFNIKDLGHAKKILGMEISIKATGTCIIVKRDTLESA